MKKISILIAFVIVLTGLMPKMVYGENGYDKKLEELILMTKDLFNISDEYDKFDSYVSSYDNNILFSLSWLDSEDKLNHINVNIDINGNIISYSNYPTTYEEPSKKLPTYSEKEAEEIAMNFISKIDKEISKSIQLIPNNNPMNTYDRNYYFNYVRYENNIPFRQNTVTVNVNKYTGEVTSYYANWDRNLEFPSPKNIISLEEGKEAYEKDIGLDLIYKTNRYYALSMDSKNGSNFYLAYSPLYTNSVIDAFTGEKVVINFYDIYFNTKEEAKYMDLGVKSSLTPAERQSVDKLTGLFNEREIEKIAREILKIGNDYELNNISLFSNYKNTEDYTWNLYFQKQIDKDKYNYVNIALDAKTGELINFYKSLQHNENAESNINKESALELAKEYIKKMNPNQSNEIELIKDMNSIDNQLTYSFQFIRKINGIFVENDIIAVGVDGVNKEVYSYTIDWYKGELPSSDNIISLDKAYEVLWNKIGLELNYVYTLNNSKGEVKLVYSLKEDKAPIISAISGEVLDYSGKPYKENKIISYTDLDNSYAKEKIETLGKYGVGFYEEEFRPKDKIRQRDFIYLLWKSINQYRLEPSSDDDMYKEFISMGYIKEDEKDPDKIITKEEAIKYIIRVMKLDKVAEIEGIYKDIFKDSMNITEELKGYINIAYGLKIISGDGSGNIGAKNLLKREDAANIIYNYMFN